MSLSLIYHFQASQNQEGVFRPASYHVVYFFSHEGFLEKKQLQELSKSIPDADHDQVSFLSLDDLKHFALRTAEELNAPEVRLISVQDYNIGLDGARDQESFQAIFTKFGDVVVNEGATSKKKGFLDKFFS